MQNMTLVIREPSDTVRDPDNSVGITTRLPAGRSEFNSRQRLGIFLFANASTPALGPTQPPIQWVPVVLSLGVKRPGHESGHSLPSSAEVKNAWSYTSPPQCVFMAWRLFKHRDMLTFRVTQG
jgi:hypothetical protein